MPIASLAVSALAAVILVAKPSSRDADTFYVSTVGNDAWSGRLAEPGRDRTDGPFACHDRSPAGSLSPSASLRLCEIPFPKPSDRKRTLAKTPSRKLTWLGFVSLANDKAVFHLDNVRLEPGNP